jgi:hypothetical protein
MKARTLMIVLLIFAFAAMMSAQVQKTTKTSSESASVQTQVEKGEVVLVSGNDLVVKMPDGTLRHFNNVPESARITVDGQQMGIHDLKPGMHLQKTVTTTTTPKVITTTQSVTGKVWHVSPPNSVILTLEDGTNQKFTIPKGQKFTVDGQEMDAFGLKKGMRVNATKVVEEPLTVVEQRAQVSGKMPPPPPPPADQPVLVATAAPAPAPVAAAAAAEPAAAKLPKTGSILPLLGLLGTLSLAGSAGLRKFRK